MRLLIFVVFLAVSGAAYSADEFSADEMVAIQKGDQEWGIWSGGGSGVSGSTRDTRLLSIGIRYGRILTGAGPAGYLAYQMEATPLFLTFQSDTVYGAMISPVLLRWSFTSGSPIAPYMDFGFGMLFTHSPVPENTSRLNFTPQAGFGFYFHHKPRRSLRFEARYMHISNGGLETPNPGINSIQFHFGYQWSR